MRNNLFILLLLTVLFVSCDRDRPVGLPSCVQVWIDVVKKEPTWNPPAEVNEYFYKGKTVYLLSANCCDQYITLIDSSCSYICAPSGGFSGRGDERCTDFYAKAKFIRQVWKDAR
jgi:hypothetical protein